MPSTAQLLKASGNLTAVPLDQLDSAAAAVEDLEFVVENNPCGHPHNFDDEIADSDPATLSAALDLPEDYCDTLIHAHAAMRAAATGSGSYPHSCNPKYPGVHAVSYFDDPATWPSHLKRTLTDEEFQGIIDSRVWGPSGDHNGRPFTMAELKSIWGNKPLNEVVNDFAEETYRRMSVILNRVDSGHKNIVVSYPVIPGSVIGVGWYPGSDSCPGDRVNLHIDKTYTNGFQGQFGLKIHELGHTLQLKHQFDNQERHQEPMSYRYRQHLVVGYSTGDPIFGIPKSPSVAVLTRLYGGVTVGVPWKGKTDTTTPPPLPPGGRIVIDPVMTTKDTLGNTIITNEITYEGDAFVVARKMVI